MCFFGALWKLHSLKGIGDDRGKQVLVQVAPILRHHNASSLSPISVQTRGCECAGFSSCERNDRPANHISGLVHLRRVPPVLTTPISHRYERLNFPIPTELQDPQKF